MVSDGPSTLEYIEIDPPGRTQHTIVWLHGLGADGNDFVPMVRELALPDSLGMRFVFPHAPVRPVTVNGGYAMRAWYDILHPDLTREVDRAGIHASLAAVSALVQREVSRGIPRSSILLAGFSQGGVIALHLALRSEAPMAGVIAMSTYLPLVDELPRRSFHLPLFWGHGTSDPLVPLEIAETGRTWLQTQGHTVSWHLYPMPHSVCPREIADIRAWILSAKLQSGASR